MNKIFTFLIAALLLLTCGCGEMDQYPHNGVSSDNLTEDDAEMLLTGLYAYMQYKPTANGYLTQDIVGGNLVRSGATGLKTPALVIRDLITAESGFVSGPWNGYYTCLYQVNSFIVSVSKMTETSARNEMLAAAFFFRGLIYYNLVTRYGEVPILREPYSGDIAASTEAEGWSFVEENLEYAMKYAPSFTDKNYVSSQAAKALLARTCLAQGKMERAAQLAEELITDSHFALADFDQIFRGKANSEEIFTFSNLLDELSVNISSVLYSRSGPNGGSYTYAPSSEVMNMFEPNDKREEISIAMQESNEVINKYPGGEVSTDPIIIARLGEMYLISAEAQGLSKGLTRLNELRVFRGLEPVSPTTEAAFIDAVLKERRVELLAEGFRWFDLVRHGLLESTLGIEHRYNRLPIPSTEISLNKLLKQNSYWSE
jgi:hypothetical protein